jgi:hypothetical protein
MNAQVIHIIDTYLTRSVRSIAESERLKPCSSLRRIVLLGAFCLCISSSAIWVQPVEAATRSDYFKLYAHSRIIDSKQYECFQKIIFKESRWNPQAKNGSHYGLGQMRSVWYRDLDPYRQIDESIRYITNRYNSMCNAWAHHKKKGFY